MSEQQEQIKVSTTTPQQQQTTISTANRRKEIQIIDPTITATKDNPKKSEGAAGVKKKNEHPVVICKEENNGNDDTVTQSAVIQVVEESAAAGGKDEGEEGDDDLQTNHHNHHHNCYPSTASTSSLDTHSSISTTGNCNSNQQTAEKQVQVQPTSGEQADEATVVPSASDDTTDHKVVRLQSPSRPETAKSTAKSVPIVTPIVASNNNATRQNCKDKPVFASSSHTKAAAQVQPLRPIPVRTNTAATTTVVVVKTQPAAKAIKQPIVKTPAVIVHTTTTNEANNNINSNSSSEVDCQSVFPNNLKKSSTMGSPAVPIQHPQIQFRPAGTTTSQQAPQQQNQQQQQQNHNDSSAVGGGGAAATGGEYVNNNGHATTTMSSTTGGGEAAQHVVNVMPQQSQRPQHAHIQQQQQQPYRNVMRSSQPNSPAMRSRDGAASLDAAPPLFERLFSSEEAQDMKTYSRIIGSQNRRLTDLERVHDDLEIRLEEQTKARMDLEAELDAQQRMWSERYAQLEKERDEWKNKVSAEQNKNELLLKQINHKNKEIHRMIQHKYDVTSGGAPQHVQHARNNSSSGSISKFAAKVDKREYKSPHEILSQTGSKDVIYEKQAASTLLDFFGIEGKDSTLV
uniref:Uncharacterized protein n=1 Tax=Leptocylindrus danicus TaxID=163516 RepID=A0A7S2KAU5_9STRA|mmetsp:Transcript_20682/g.30780  ORF Transcript_20682/g.30780 Transcript_20682/m.30780 type:complete len:626 (+) Transcript_20682:332-2209(+)|eukprot:CAMPEP_0116009756 /NCGR_PEP_ID=MMETSP0321-20121206/3612_1 /TAXON_ID=163516 /ORGANISM="Leptocylindrus danicus var. danicus, Strain B650" /LENGTH=625 /DNA_ID=CAMNT_0003478759 /DNA_START=321 /DNA_END=2198 /DNA_ORIENTATION=-